MTDAALIPYQDIVGMAKAVVASRLFPQIQSEQAALTLMMLCQADGIHPMMALRRYDIIQGRPALKADAMLAEFQKRGGKVKWLKLDETGAEAEFMSPGLVAPVRIKFDQEDARRAGLLTKDNYKKYPRPMYRARVISEGVRTADPGVNAGVHAPEEVADFDEPRRVAAEAEIMPPPAPAAAQVAEAFDGEIVEETPEAQRRTGPVCDCGSPTLIYESESKQFMHRKYRMCEWAYDEKRNMLEEGATNKLANAAVASHFREWAEPWPRGASDAPSVARVQPSDGNHGTLGPETFAKIQEQVAAKLAEEA